MRVGLHSKRIGEATTAAGSGTQITRREITTATTAAGSGTHRKIRAADKQVNLFKKREERVQELKRQVNKEAVMRQAEEKMRQSVEEELIHVRALMTQEVQRVAKETLVKEAFRAELNAAIRRLTYMFS